MSGLILSISYFLLIFQMQSMLKRLIYESVIMDYILSFSLVAGLFNCHVSCEIVLYA